VADAVIEAGKSILKALVCRPWIIAATGNTKAHFEIVEDVKVE
jgi:hypothetical protein